MLLKKIKITNYRRLEDVSIEFSKGITIVSGLNGAGKSTLFEAVAWTLFGQTASRTGAKAVIGSYLPRTAKCRILLHFNLDGQEFQIERVVDSKGSGNAVISAGKQELANGVSAVNSFICNLLGLNYQSFQTSFYAKQNELNYLADIPPAQRLKHLISMLGLNRLDKTVELIRKDRLRADALVAALGEIEEKIDFKLAINEKKEILAEKLADLQDLQLVVKNLLKLLNEKEAILRELKEKLAKNIKLKEEYDSLKEQNQELDQQIKILNRQVAEIEELNVSEKNLTEEQNKLGYIEDLQKRLEELSSNQKERKLLEDELLALNNELTAQENELTIINNNIKDTGYNQKRQKELELKLSDLSESNIQVNTQIKNKRNELKHLNKENDNLENELKQLAVVKGEKKCPMCLRPFGDDFQEFKKHLIEKCNSLQESIIMLTTAGKELRRKLDSLKKETEDTDLKLTAQRKYHNDLQGWQAKKNILERIVAELVVKEKALQERIRQFPEVVSGEYQLLQDQLNRLNEIVKQLRKIELKKVQLPLLQKQVSIINNNVIDNNNKLEQLQLQLQSVDSLEHKETIMQKEWQDLQEKQRDKSKYLEILKGEVINLERDLTDLKQKKKLNQEKEEQIRIAADNSRQLKRLQTTFKELKTVLTGRIKPEFERISSQLLSDISNGRYLRLELDQNFNINVYDNNGCYPLERFSGGEQDLFNICLRLAIALYLAQATGHEYSFIVLDEIFGSQDRFRQEAILQLLEGLKKHFRQIFLITHIDEIKNRAANLLEIERHGDISKVYPSY